MVYLHLPEWAFDFWTTQYPFYLPLVMVLDFLLGSLPFPLSEGWCWLPPVPTPTDGHMIPTWSMKALCFLTTMISSEIANETFARTAGFHLLLDLNLGALNLVSLELLLPRGYHGRSSYVRRESAWAPVLCPITSFELLNQTIPKTRPTPTLFNKIPFSLIHLEGSFPLPVYFLPTLNLPF